MVFSERGERIRNLRRMKEISNITVIKTETFKPKYYHETYMEQFRKGR